MRMALNCCTAINVRGNIKAASQKPLELMVSSLEVMVSSSEVKVSSLEVMVSYRRKVPSSRPATYPCRAIAVKSY